MCGTDDEELLVGGVGVGFADDVIALGTAIHHVVVGSFAEVAAVGLLAVHDEDGGAYLVDIV